MTLFPVMGIFIVLMAGVVIVGVVVVLGVMLSAAGRRGGRSGRVPLPGDMDPMTETLHPSTTAGHGQAGLSAADRLIATGIAVDTLAASQGSGHGHGHHGGHPAGHDAGMHPSQDMSSPMHHDPGPTTMPSHVDSGPSHHG